MDRLAQAAPCPNSVQGVTRGYKDGLQPETLADGNWLVKQNQPVSEIETKSDTNLRSLDSGNPNSVTPLISNAMTVRPADRAEELSPTVTDSPSSPPLWPVHGPVAHAACPPAPQAHSAPLHLVRQHAGL
jgi:hypothetical protein